MTDKLRKNGKVAVIYSPGYGASWSTGYDQYPDMVFDPTLAEMLLRPKPSFKTMEAYAEKKWPDAYLGGLKQCHVKWVDEGEKFRIREYDGSESVELLSQMEFFVA